VDPLGVLPGEQDLSRRAGTHGELGSDRDRVPQPGRALGGGDADTVVTLPAPQLRRLAGDVTQACEHRAGGGEQAVLAGGDGELGEARPEHEPALEVARHQTVVLQGHGEPVGGGPGETGGGHQAGQGGGPGLERGQHEGRLVEDPDAAGVVHMAILPSQIMGRKL
jgi:hypothetical protein